MIFSLAWIFSMEYHVYWSLKSCSCFKLFGDEKYGIFWAKTLTERWTLLITKKFLLWLFWWWEIRSFFESKSWWKDDIYWLLRSSFFKLFGDGKYGLFSAKILMERWYLLSLFELFMIQQWLSHFLGNFLRYFKHNIIDIFRVDEWKSSLFCDWDETKNFVALNNLLGKRILVD